MGGVGAHGDCVQGPPRIHEAEGSQIRIHFAHVGGGWKRMPPACYRASQSPAQTINSTSRLQKNSCFGFVLKGRGFKPRRKCDKIDPALAAEAAPQTAMPLFSSLLGQCSYRRRYGPRLASRSALLHLRYATPRLPPLLAISSMERACPLSFSGRTLGLASQRTNSRQDRD